MSKQHPLDAREPRDLHHLLITDSGWDLLGDGETYCRNISTTQPLTYEQKVQLQKWVAGRPMPAPGLRVLMNVDARESEYTFVTRPVRG